MIENLNEIRDDISSWLDKLSEDMEPGRFRFSLSESKNEINNKSVQFVTCFAMRTAWQTGLWEEWSREKRKNCIDYIKSFQLDNGYFYEPVIVENKEQYIKTYLKYLLGRINANDLKNRKIYHLRADTRQSIGTLFMVGEVPNNILPMEIDNLDDIKEYFNNLNWSNPWGAGSQFSHLMFILGINRKYFGLKQNYEEYVSTIMNCLDSIKDPITGTWFMGSPMDSLKINGAMKILAGLYWINKECNEIERLIDFALDQPFLFNGCDFFNRLFVIYRAYNQNKSSYRIEDIKNLAFIALQHIDSFKKPDGGFSFFEKTASKKYYGIRVSSGGAISDLHGTAMITWAISIICHLLGKDAPVGADNWKIYIP